MMLAALALAGPAAALPPVPPAAIERLLGQYGTNDFILTVYEAGGQLYADAPTVVRSLMTCTGTVCAVEYRGDQLVPLSFQIRGGQVVAAVLMEQRLPRHDFGADVVSAIQAKVEANPAMLDIRYATSNNFMGFPLYEKPSAYMQRPAAEALGRAQTALAAQGYGLLIHDAYRPWFVTKMFWDATPPDSRIFVADPAKGSRHNRGCAVDLSMYDLKTGKPVEMTGRYDEMSTRSYADFVGGTSRQRALRAILRTAMEAQGFTVLSEEWWHFDYKDWASYGIGTATFTELASER